MCGIAGLIGWTGTENQISDIIKKFQSSLHHRGPDNKGHWVSKKEMISLVHTRLSILDLSKSGNQPMHSSCDRYTISFNAFPSGQIGDMNALYGLNIDIL